MLDFYLINDDQSKPRNPGQARLVYAGGLDDRTFENLQAKGIIDRQFDYYSDFRWTTELIKQIRQTILKKQVEKDMDVIKLTQLLDAAERQQAGLIAYGD